MAVQLAQSDFSAYVSFFVVVFFSYNKEIITKIYGFLPHFSLQRINSGLEKNYKSLKGSNCHLFSSPFNYLLFSCLRDQLAGCTE